ncbi:HAD-IA family hydrolase [Qipengyuania sp. MTN3-11]|uniref:HAD-IA family hydrolase n=1 Tax=Qipengyuania sp. MTN3-11 TaxID=3056557 RepID=UPI0036F24528
MDIVVFDLDGTLVDTSPDLVAALNVTLEHLGRSTVTSEMVAHLAGEGARALLRRGLELTGGVHDDLIENGVPIFLSHYENHISDLSVVPMGCEDALTELDGNGVRLGVCTNKPEQLARKLLEELGWIERFASIVGGDTLAVRKPDPAPLLRCVAECGDGRAAFVGDSSVDLQTAEAVDLPFWFLSATGADSPVGVPPERRISGFDRLLPALHIQDFR